MAHEVDQQVQLLGRQADVLTVAGDPPAEQVKLDARRSQPWGMLAGGYAQMRAYPRRELLEGERLGQIVVGAGVEAPDPVGDLCASGEHDHRGAALGGAHALDDLKAVTTGEHDVEHDKVEVLPERTTLTLHTVEDRLHHVALGSQPPLDEVSDRLLVLDDEYVHERSITRQSADIL